MGQRILVADDEEGIVLLLKDYFELQGYEVITAGGGMEALDRIRCGPDMIILDIDYIVKPFSIEELGARVMAHLRREERGRHSGAVRTDGNLTIYYQERSVVCGSHPVGLTRTEYDIFSFLSLHPGQVFSKERIYENVRGYDASGDSSIVAEHVRRIRNKIAEYTDQEVIRTVWGVGYQWIGSTKR